MAKLPTSQEKARLVLEIFKKLDQRPGESLPQGVFAANANGRSEDINDGLEYAEKQGWIERREDKYGLSNYKLTTTGFEEM